MHACAAAAERCRRAGQGVGDTQFLAQSAQYPFSTVVFTSWDYHLTDVNAARNLRNTIRNQLSEMLSDAARSDTVLSTAQRWGNLLIKVAAYSGTMLACARTLGYKAPPSQAPAVPNDRSGWLMSGRQLELPHLPKMCLLGASVHISKMEAFGSAVLPNWHKAELLTRQRQFLRRASGW